MKTENAREENRWPNMPPITATPGSAVNASAHARPHCAVAASNECHPGDAARPGKRAGPPESA
ncbi:MAG: hypothetical protein N2483_03945 [Burkholderiaceae bacterium]|nr:hypothetical protein [Burkholderiaceae bacterium]